MDQPPENATKIDCAGLSQSDPHARGKCPLKLHRGTISPGVCRACPQWAGRNSPAYKAALAAMQAAGDIVGPCCGG